MYVSPGTGETYLFQASTASENTNRTAAAAKARSFCARAVHSIISMMAEYAETALLTVMSGAAGAKTAVENASRPIAMTVSMNAKTNWALPLRELYPDREYSFSFKALEMKKTMSIIWARAKKLICRIKLPYAPAASPAAENSIARHICHGSIHGDIMVSMASGKAVLYGMSRGRKYSAASSMNRIDADRVIRVLVFGVVFCIAVSVSGLESLSAVCAVCRVSQSASEMQ